MNQFFRLVYFLKYAKKETAIRILLGLGIVGAQFSQTWFLAKMVIAVCEKRNMKEILLCFLAEFLSLFIRAGLIKYQEYFLKKYAAKVKNEIRSQILDKIMVLGPSFKNDQRTGNLQSLITDGVESLEAFLTQYIPQIAVVIFTTIFVTTFMCRLDRTVGLLLLFMSAVTVIVPHIFMPAVSDVMVLYWKEYAQLNAQYIDDMQGMSTLKSLGVSKKEGKRLKTQAIGFAAESMRNLGISLSDSTLITICITAGTSISILLSAIHVAQGKIPYAVLIQVLFLAGECLRPMNDLSIYWHNSYTGLSVAEELLYVLDYPVSEKPKENLQNTGIGKKPEIVLQNLSFQYEKDGADVLKNVDMVFESGKVTAIAGKSGSGKSTIVNLLLGFYETEKNRIQIDGKTLESFEPDYLRSQISVVFQDSFLFYGTVKDNIKMARPEASDAEIMQAAMAANAHEFIVNLPNGYDTLVGERGATLSGRRKTKDCHCQSDLKECANSDSGRGNFQCGLQNEQEIQNALKEAMKDRTTLVIAHRMTTIEDADKIYVMQNGHVEGCGTHEELLQKDQIYQNLVRAQSYE